MFKVGDEVSVKGEITKVCESGVVVKAHYFGEAYNDKSNMDLIGKTYEQGLADAWELAKKIYDMKCDAIEEIFGVKGGFYEVVRNFTFEDCRDKIEAYEKEKEIKVGDEVVHGEGSFQTKFTVTFFESNKVEGFDKNGNTHSFCYPNPYIKKTGKHIEIEGILKQIGE